MGVLAGFRKRRRAREVASMASRAKRAETLFDRELKRIGVDAKSDEMATYFRRLGIRHTSDRARIRDAYIRQMKEYHPDVSRRPDAQEKAKELNEAYSFLSGKELSTRLGQGAAGYGKQKRIVADGIIREYNARRKRDYEKISADLRSGSIGMEVALKRLFDWEPRFDCACNALFGRLWRAGVELGVLSERNAELMHTEKDSGLAAALEESQRRIEGARSEYKAVEAMLSDVISSIEKHVADAEAESMRRIR